MQPGSSLGRQAGLSHKLILLRKRLQTGLSLHAHQMWNKSSLRTNTNGRRSWYVGPLKGEIAMTETERVGWEGWFTASLPRGWDHEVSDGLISIRDPAGVGALQVSVSKATAAALAPSAVEAAAVLRAFAQVRSWALVPGALATQDNGAEARGDVECRHGGDYWRVWWLARDTRRLLATYNCREEDAPAEAEVCAKIVDSIQWW